MDLMMFYGYQNGKEIIGHLLILVLVDLGIFLEMGSFLNNFQLSKVAKILFRGIYGSNYARGLELLIDIWPQVERCFPKATLDIYYGWETFGLLDPKKANQLRHNIGQLVYQGVSEKGRVGHEELNRAYGKASFWTYPCTQAETFCITALRAQFAGTIPVITQWAALSETVRHGYACSHHNHYLQTLLRAMEEATNIDLQKRFNMRDFILQNYTWKTIAQKWKALFEEPL